jgi:hypothetical protein
MMAQVRFSREWLVWHGKAVAEQKLPEVTT